MKLQTLNSAGVPAMVGQFELDHDVGFISKVSNLFRANGKNSGTLIDHMVGLRGCLDKLQMNVFVADKNLNLVYMNEIALKTLKSVEPEIQKAFGLRVDELLGGSIHRFHKDPRAVEVVLRNPIVDPVFKTVV